MLRRALSIRDCLLTPDDPDLALTLFCLAEILHRQGEYAEAERLIRRTDDSGRRLLGPGRDSKFAVN